MLTLPDMFTNRPTIGPDNPTKTQVNSGSLILQIYLQEPITILKMLRRTPSGKMVQQSNVSAHLKMP